MRIWEKKYIKNTKNNKESAVTVGIMGSSPGVGTTHLAIMLAGYLSSKKHKKTALIEVNNAGTFAALKNLYCDNDIYSDEIIGNFTIGDVDYFPKQTDEGFASVFQRDYEYIILDLGCEWDNNINELLRCNVGCLVGSLSEWKISMFEKNICKLQQLAVKDSFHFVTTFGMQKLKNKIEKKYHIKIDLVPFEPTPFVLHKETFAFFEMLYI